MSFQPSPKVLAWKGIVDKWSTQLKISNALVLAVIQMESGGNPDATRYEPAFEKRYILGNSQWVKICKEKGITTREAATSYGLMQLMFTTAYGFDKSLTPAKLLEPDSNIRFGCAFLEQKLRKYTVEESLCAYNGGDGAVSGFRKGVQSAAGNYSKKATALYRQWEAYLKEK